MGAQSLSACYMSASSFGQRGDLSLSKRTFRFRGKRYKYFCHDYNATYRNERAVEISIVWEAVKQCKGRVLEVGNVLSHYFLISHEVVDKYEKAEGVLNVDIVDFAPSVKYDLIVSISTLEHVGWDEKLRDPKKILRAFENLKELLAPGGMLLVTLPLGYHLAFDRLLERKKIGFTKSYYWKRVSKDNRWRQVNWEEVRGTSYNSPFPYAGAIVIGIWKKSKRAKKTRLEDLSLWLKSGWRANIFSYLAPGVKAGQDSSEQRKLFIDCSYVWEYGGNSGIQRVVRNIVNNCKRVGEKLGVECQPVIWAGRHFISVESVDVVGRNPFAARPLHRGTKPPSPRRFREWLKRALPNSWVKAIKSSKKDLFGFLGLVSIRAGQFWNDLRFFRRRVSFAGGDVLLLLDSSWHIPFWRGVREAKKEGAVVGIVLYDLIPVHAPQFCDPPLVKHFRDWLEKATTLADFCITISEATKAEFERYEVGKGIPQIEATSFCLGAELDWMRKGGFVRGQVKDAFTGKSKPYIIVGTIEPRKNHEYLLDAFGKVWEVGVGAKLCVIGKIGWFVEDLIGRIAEHPQQGELLFMFNDLSDTELSFCYENAKALITPSLCEGFNLPIVEALSERLPVFASDIPIHRETCDEYCVYFNLKSPDSLAKLIIDFEKKGQLPPTKSPKDFRWTTWEESTEDLLKKVKHLAWGQG